MLSDSIKSHLSALADALDGPARNIDRALNEIHNILRETLIDGEDKAAELVGTVESKTDGIAPASSDPVEKDDTDETPPSSDTSQGETAPLDSGEPTIG